MNTNPINPATTFTGPGINPDVGAVLSGVAPNDSPFSKWLGANQSPSTGTTPSNADEVREAARSLVSISLIQPLLTQARQDPFRTELFHGGFAEDAFGAQLDAIIAEQITQRTDLPLVESVYRQIAGKGQANPGTRVNTHG